jgi:hypothetical protein
MISYKSKNIIRRRRGVDGIRSGFGLERKIKTAAKWVINGNFMAPGFYVEKKRKHLIIFRKFSFNFNPKKFIFVHKIFFRRSMALATIIFVLVAFYFEKSQYSRSATFNWTQTNWVSQNSNTNVNYDTSSGWTDYSAKDQATTIGSGTVTSVARSVGPISQTTYDNFNAGNNSGTTHVIGSGDSGSVRKVSTGVSTTELNLTSNRMIAMKIGTDGFARIIYADNGTNEIYFIKCANEACSSSSPVLIDSVTNDIYKVALDLDSLNRPAIVYLKGSDSKIVKCNDDSCSSMTSAVTIDNEVLDQPSGPRSIGFLPSDNSKILVAYYNSTNKKLKLAAVTCTTTCTVDNKATIDEANADDFGFQVTLKVHSDGFARIVYYSYATGVSAAIKFAKCTDLNCSSPTINTITTSVANTMAHPSDDTYVSMALGSSDELARIAYKGNDNKAKFIQCSNDDCSSVSSPVVEISAYDVSHLSIDLNSQNYPYVLYKLTNADYTSYYKACQDTTCSSLGSEVSIGDGTFGSKAMLKMGADDYPRIIYGSTAGRTQYYFPTFSTVAAGTFTSSIMDAGTNTYSWDTATWDNTAKETIAMKVRTCPSTDSDCSEATAWASCSTIDSGDDITDGLCATDGDRYVQYQVVLSTATASVTPSLDNITINYNSGDPTYTTLTSSAYDSGDFANTISNIQWSATLNGSSSVKFQIRTAPDNGSGSPNWAGGSGWCGPNDFVSDSCSSSTYFTNPAGGEEIDDIQSDISGNQWFQYKAFLFPDGADGTIVPVLNDVTMTYVSNASPTINTVTATQGSDGIIDINYNVDDADIAPGTSTIYFGLDVGATLSGTLTTGATSITLAGNYSNLPNGAQTQTILIDQEFITCTNRSTTTLSGCSRAQNSSRAASHGSDPVNPKVWFVGTNANTTGDGLVTNGNGKTGTWTIKEDLDGVYYATANVRVIANDGEAANQVSNSTGATTATTFILDTKDPTAISFKIKHNQSSNNITNIAATDDSAKQMNFSNDGIFTEESYVSLATPYTYSGIISGDPATVHMRVKDAYGNYADATVVTPAKPTNVVYYDTSNASSSEYREFIAWSVVSALQVGSGFSKYNVWRSAPDSLTLNEALSNSDTTAITVTDASFLPTSGTIIIDEEQITYTSKSGNDLAGTIARGAGNTVATTHSSGATIWVIAGSSSDRNINYYLNNDLVTDVHYYFKVTTEDTSGNISAFSSTIDDIPNGQGGTDSTAPTISNVLIDEDFIGTTFATITWDTDEVASSSVGYSPVGSETPYSATLGNASVVTNHSITLIGLEPNTTYNIQLISEDLNGNTATNDASSPGAGNQISDYSFTTLPGPGISLVTTPSTSNTQFTVQWKTTTASDSYVVYSDAVSGGALVDSESIGAPDLVTTLGSDSLYTHTQTVSTYNDVALSAGTTYYFYVQSTDASSNTSVLNNSGNFYSVKTTSDVADPIISGIDELIINNTSAAINWTTDEPATSVVNYGTVSGTYTLSSTVSTYDRSHYVILTGLTADTTYYYTVTSADINTNSDTDDNSGDGYTFTTLKDPGYQHDALSAITDVAVPPTIITDTKAVISFNTDQAALCFIESGTSSANYTNDIFKEDGYDAQTDFNTYHAISMNGLIFSTKYYYKITCNDNLDNVVSSDEYSFTTSETLYTAEGAGALNDTTAPSISGVGSGTLTGESATIEWNTNEEANSLIRYGITTDYGDMAGNDLVNIDVDNYVTSHSVIIHNLIPATKYYYVVISADASGNVAVSSENTFSTSSPSNISSIKVVSTALGKATITWSTSKDITSIVEYGLTTSYGEIKQSNTLTKVHSIELSSLNSSVTYHFRVKGKDADNNFYSSADYTFEPKSPPTLSNKRVEDITEHSAIVKFSTNVPTSALVTYTDPKDPKNSGSQGMPNLTSTHEVELKNLPSGVTFATKIKVTDEQGNSTEEDGTNFTVGKDETAPKIDQVRTDSALAQNDKVQTIVSWITEEPATTSFIYKEGRNGQEKETKISDSLSTNHVAVITILKPGTVYYFKVKSVDQSENIAISTDYALLTPRRKENIIQIIVNNFQDIFGWMNIK